MTKIEFDKLTQRPSMMVSWGGKRYKMTSVDKAKKTCYLRVVGSSRKAYAVDYTSVILEEPVKRTRSVKQ